MSNLGSKYAIHALLHYLTFLAFRVNSNMFLSDGQLMLLMLTSIALKYPRNFFLVVLNLEIIVRSLGTFRDISKIPSLTTLLVGTLGGLC